MTNVTKLHQPERIRINKYKPI